MRATFCALEPEDNRFRFPSVRGHGPLLQHGPLLHPRQLDCRRPPCGRPFVLWNQKVTDTGSLLFAGMARSYTPASINQVSTTVSGFSDMLSMPWSSNHWASSG